MQIIVSPRLEDYNEERCILRVELIPSFARVKVYPSQSGRGIPFFR